MKVEWLPTARKDRRDQIVFLKRHGPRAAEAAGLAILASVRNLGDFPLIGRTGRIPGTREIVVTGTPYVIAYRIVTDAVVILRLMHGKQEWPDVL